MIVNEAFCRVGRARPSQSPYGGGSPGVPPKRGYRAVGDPWTPRSTRSFPTGLAVGGFRAARLVEKHQALGLGSEGLGELAGAGPRSSSAGGGRPGNSGSLVDLLCFFRNNVRISPRLKRGTGEYRVPGRNETYNSRIDRDKFR